VRPWFARLSLHRKLVALALGVSTVALVVALVGLTVFDILRFRARAADDAATLAGVIARNSAAAVAFQDPGAAEEMLASLAVRPEVTRACIYLADGTLFAAYERGADPACPDEPPASAEAFHAAVFSPIVRNERTWGSVYVERDLSDLAHRLGMAAVVALIVLLGGGVLAFLLAQRLTRSISTPVTRLATAARHVGGDAGFPSLDIPASEDEIGDLVRAFQAMLTRIRNANDGLVREIEERKKVEADRELLLANERETSRMKDEFVATVSHELRTPLGVILTWAHILQAAEPDEATLGRALSAISRSAGEQARIIDDLVDVSRIATGKLHLQRESLDLRQPVETSVEIARPAAETKGVQIDLEVPVRPCPVDGDPDRLRQLAGNLLSNAVKFSDEGGRVSVRLRDLGSTYELEVTDDGIGIPPDVLPHVFERYRQADSSMTRRHSGLGLGLSIVKEVTELHGGSVVATSGGTDQGASFRVRLPKLIVSMVETERPPEAEPVGERLEGVTVLAVDDNLDALAGMATALRAVGARVRTAPSGKEALESMDREPPDVVLCDLAMPEMDGFEVLARVRRREDGAARPIPAIAVSAHATLEHRERSIAAGFAEHVSKPYKVPELIQAVKAALEVKVR